MNKKAIFIFIFVLFVILLLGFSAYSQKFVVELAAIFGDFTNKHPVFASFIFISLSFVSTLLGPFTSVPLAPLAVATWGILITSIFILTGWLLGGAAAYLIGKYAGQALIGAIVGQERLKKWVTELKPHMSFSLLLLFRLAMPAETGYIFGLLNYNFKRYLLIIFLAELPFALLIVYASDAFIRTAWWLFAMLLLAAFAIAVFTYRLFTHHFRR